jgi:mannose-6-phosphate isomerase
MQLYPLKFIPISKHKIWGGDKLKTELNKNFTENNIGESWEISDVDGDPSIVSAGALQGKTLRELSEQFTSKLLGNKVYEQFGVQFPLLIKFIDAKTPLSIQVHPHDEIAKTRHNSFGKNEMWYILDADNNAEIIVGFNKSLNKEQYTEYLENNQVLDVLNCTATIAGDAFYIPTGRVHAIGAGVLLAEIQQTSDITYRIYDYNRVDQTTGKERELHTDLALDVLDFKLHDSYKTDYALVENTPNELINSPYFKTAILKLTDSLTRDYIVNDSFTIIICVDGGLTIQANGSFYSLVKGETMLIPACITVIQLTPQPMGAKIIEVNV